MTKDYLLSYCGRVDSKIGAEIDLPVPPNVFGNCLETPQSSTLELTYYGANSRSPEN